MYEFRLVTKLRSLILDTEKKYDDDNGISIQKECI